jgi:hypothetical protein
MFPSHRADGAYMRGGFIRPKYNPFDAEEANTSKYAVRDLDLPMGVD